jgi:hypothetical protein
MPNDLFGPELRRAAAALLRLLLTAWILGALAESHDAAAQSRQQVALVVGNGAYRNVTPLPNPTNDARLMARTLRNVGFTVLGGDAQTNVTKGEFDQLLQRFGAQIQGVSVALFYYAGHGLQVNGVNYLVPIEANPTRPADLDFQMVDADVVLRQMSGSGSKLNLVILDACRNNPFGGRGLRETGGGLAQMRAPRGTLIAYATQPGSVAQDGDDGDSPFTRALAQTIMRPGLDILHMFNEVGLVVDRNTGGNQQPWVSTSPIDGEFYFVAPPGPTVLTDKAPIIGPQQPVADTGTGQKLAMAYPKLTVPPPPPGPGLTVGGTWRGRYHYPNNAQAPVQFQFDIETRGARVTGRSQEPNTFGEAGVPYLYATINGTVTPDGQLRFTKTYDGTGRVSHSVEYEGIIDYSTGTLSGTWHIGATRGQFEMQKVMQQ